MTAARLHEDEFPIAEPQVRHLLDTQFPQWSGLALVALSSHGTDNVMFRLGADLAVRLPRRPSAALQLEKEWHWLPRLAPHLPYPVPVPLARGEPDAGYPSCWAVCRWLDGDNPDPLSLADPRRLAVDLAHFLRALRGCDTAGGLPPGRHNFWRGQPLAHRDRFVRAAIGNAHDLIDADAVTQVWDADLAAPVWDGPPLWIHGDLSPGNLLLTQGRLGGVIDFGGLGVGDPACDLLGAWYVFGREGRAAFRAALGADDASWARGRGWALSMALNALSYYRDTNPAMVASSLRVISEVLAEREKMSP